MHDAHVHHCRGCRGAADFTLPGAQAHYPPDLRLEPVHLDIALTLDIDAERASGAVTHTIRSRRGGVSVIRLHAMDLDVEDVTDPAGHALTWAYDGRELELRWKDDFEAGEERKATIRYAVEEPSTGLFFSHPLPEYPERAYYAATDHETERARHWLPTIDLPNVRTPVDWHLRARSDLTILANGAKVGEEAHDDGTKTVHWKLEQPCPSYLLCFAIGDLVEHDDGEWNGLELKYYATSPRTSEDLARSFGRTRDMLEWMSKKLGHDFPYPKYYQFGLPGFGGAMENISLVSWDDMFVIDETLAHEWTWLVDQINVHEMAHSYFGDMITCRDFAHAWLKESWATYMETLWLEDGKSLDECDYDVFVNVHRYLDEADGSYKRPIVTREFNTSWQMYDRHLYPGGASRLHMLRKELGDETFFAGVRLYVQRFAFKTVETDDFRKTLEEVSGRSLVRWFDQWILGKGYPHVAAKFEYDKQSGLGTFTLEQKQIDEKAGIPAFHFGLELGWTIDGESHTRTVEVSEAKHQFVVALPSDPDQVRVDATNRVVSKLEFDPGEKKLLAQLTGATDVVGRIRAGQTLLKGGKRKRVRAVADAYRDEPFWGVRLEWGKALAKAGTRAAVDALAELIGHEQDGLVLETLIRSTASLREDAIADAVLARLDGDLELYRARQAAYEVLGARRANAPFDRLAGWADEHADEYGFQQSGAFRALAATRSPRAAELLTGHVRFGRHDPKARPAAATALGALGRHLPREQRPAIAETLIDLLRDPIDRVRAAAVQGLAALGQASALGALASYADRLSDQERVGVERAMARIRAAQEPSTKSADDALEELKKQVRELQDQVQKLEEQSKAKTDGDDA